MRAFVIVGRTAHASARVRLDDLPGTSGRLDVLTRCIRAALCVSHGVRRDTVVYLVLLGDVSPRTIRIEGSDARFIRPDERPLATLLIKTLARVELEDAAFVRQRSGVSVACAGLDVVLEDLASRGVRELLMLEEGAPALSPPTIGSAAFFVGDHHGFDPLTREALLRAGALPVGLGPVSLHSDDVVTVVHSELDRRGF
jgi:tRNA (pseudouridine54-N1)-methyltransferase